MQLLTLAGLLHHCFCARVCLCFCRAPPVAPMRFCWYQRTTSGTWHTWQDFPRPSCAGTPAEVCTTPPYEMDLRALWNVSAYVVHVSLLMCGYKQQYAVDSLWILWGSRLCVRECRENFEKWRLWKKKLQTFRFQKLLQTATLLVFARIDQENIKIFLVNRKKNQSI